MADVGNNKLPAPPDRLRSVAISCWRIFEQCTRLSLIYSQSGVPSDTLTYDYGRFRIWCGNLGVRQGGHASLDWRLRDAEAMEATIFTMLKDLEDDLQQFLQTTTKAVSSVDPPSDEELSDLDEISPTEELRLRSEAIASTIKSLYEMSFLIRNQSTRRLAYAKAQNYHPRDPDEEALLQSFLPHDQRHVEDFSKDLRRDEEHSGPERFDREPNAMLEDNNLKKRCVAAITARRRQLAYWKNHDRKLQSEGDVDQPERAGTLFSGTQASGVVKPTTTDLVETRSIVSSMASTVRDIDGNEALFPGPPKRASEHDAFVCSYCFVLCGSEDAKHSRWRKHIREDLQPYLCTFPDCPDGSRLYGNHHDWADHEKAAHGNILADRTQCPICLLPAAKLPRHQTFPTHLASHLERLSVACLPPDADFGDGEIDTDDSPSSSVAEGGISATLEDELDNFRQDEREEENIAEPSKPPTDDTYRILRNWNMGKFPVRQQYSSGQDTGTNNPEDDLQDFRGNRELDDESVEGNLDRLSNPPIRRDRELLDHWRGQGTFPRPPPSQSESSRDEDEVTSSDMLAQPTEQMDWRMPESIGSLAEWAKKRRREGAFDSDEEMEEFADSPPETEGDQTIPNESEARRQELEHGMEAHTHRTREEMERNLREIEEQVASLEETTKTDGTRTREKLDLIREELERRGHDTEEDVALRIDVPRTREEMERTREELKRRVHDAKEELSSWKKEMVAAEVRKALLKEPTREKADTDSMLSGEAVKTDDVARTKFVVRVPRGFRDSQPRNPGHG